MSDDSTMIIETGSGTPFSTPIKELVETVAYWTQLNKETKDNPFVEEILNGVCTLLSNEIKLQLQLQQDAVVAYTDEKAKQNKAVVTAISTKKK